MKVRQFAIIFLFVTVCSALSLLSFFGHLNDFGSDQSVPPSGPARDLVDDSFFKIVNYYSVSSGHPSLELESTELSHSSVDGIVIAFNPNGIIYRYEKNGSQLEPILFQSKNSRVLLNKKEIYLENEVEIKMTNTDLKAQKVSILGNGETMYAEGDVNTLSNIEKTNDQILVNSKNATYWPKLESFEYRNSVDGLIKRKRAYEQNISFKSDLLTLKIAESLATLKGNVFLQKENLDASAHTGEIFLENYNKKLKYYALYDDVRLQERLEQDGRKLLRKAFSEKLEGFISDKRIILTGLPKVFQDRDVIKGNKITIRENIETVEVDDANSSITLEKDKTKRE